MPQAAKHNRNIVTSRSTRSRLSMKCVDESCMWYVGVVAKPEHGLGWSHLIGVLTVVYLLAQPLMVEWWIVIFLQQNLFHCCKKNTRQQFITSETSLKGSIIGIIFLTIRYEMRNNKLFQRYSGIGKSLTKGWESYCWHTWIKKLAPGTGGTPYLGTSSVIQYCAMYFRLSLHALKDSNIVS